MSLDEVQGQILSDMQAVEELEAKLNETKNSISEVAGQLEALNSGNAGSVRNAEATYDTLLSTAAALKQQAEEASTHISAAQNN
ncbi:hypothetical protein [Haloglycomyces albus]|uniref:hypothetical protein n=1 Tax=Haloglycomyces albus TaxID=526067 RepID=UPI00046D4A5A|nr:hypothetical protein [Haloglycomyces albus]